MVADVAVDDEEDGLDESEDEELEGVHLPQQHAERDQHRRGAKAALQHSKDGNLGYHILTPTYGR